MEQRTQSTYANRRDDNGALGRCGVTGNKRDVVENQVSTRAGRAQMESVWWEATEDKQKAVKHISGVFSLPYIQWSFYSSCAPIQNSIQKIHYEYMKRNSIYWAATVWPATTATSPLCNRLVHPRTAAPGICITQTRGHTANVKPLNWVRRITKPQGPPETWDSRPQVSRPNCHQECWSFSLK